MSADPPADVDLTPATAPERDLLAELHRTVGLAELHAAIHNQSTREEG
jgi:hypothetical protein